MQITIDKEFKDLIPPLQKEERDQLEANIKAEGCRDPLTRWGDILIDGHNRHEICTRLGVPFRTVSVSFPDRSHAIEWIIRNQFGRRNLSAYDRGTLALRLDDVFAKRNEEKRKATVGRPSKEELAELALVKEESCKAPEDAFEAVKDTPRSMSNYDRACLAIKVEKELAFKKMPISLNRFSIFYTNLHQYIYFLLHFLFCNVSLKKESKILKEVYIIKHNNSYN